MAMQSYMSNIWVALFSVITSIGLDVFEGVVHQPTIAAFVTKFAGAVHQLLLTTRVERERYYP